MKKIFQGCKYEENQDVALSSKSYMQLIVTYYITCSDEQLQA